MNRLTIIVLLSCLFGIIALTTAEVKVVYQENKQYAYRYDKIEFQLDDTTTFDVDNVYQFGHAKSCEYIQNEIVPRIDTIGECFSTDGIKIGTITSKCQKYQTDKDAKIAFELELTTQIQSKATISCIVNYVQDPTIGRVSGDNIYYRKTLKTTRDTDQTGPIILSSKFPQFTQYTTDLTLKSYNYTTNTAIISFSTPSSGVFTFHYDSTTISITSEAIYCYEPTQITTKHNKGINDDDDRKAIGRLYIDPITNILYVHKQDKSNDIECTLTITPINSQSIIPRAVLTIERGSPYESHFEFELFQATNIAVPDVYVADNGADKPPTYGNLTIPFYTPMGIKKGAKFFITFDEITKLPTSSSSSDYKKIDTFIHGFKISEDMLLPNGFKYIESDKSLGIEYIGDKDLEESTIVLGQWLYDEKSFPSQADIIYTKHYDDVNIDDKYKIRLTESYINPNDDNKLPPYKFYIRGVLRNKLIQTELTDNGWTFNLTTVVTSYLNTIDYQDGNGWVTQFYITDSYNAVDREYPCRSTRDNTLPIDQWDIPYTYSDFGTMYVFSKAKLSHGESIYINCMMPLQYQNLSGYLPPADKRQLRVATWSYDKTVNDGSNLYEGNHSHSIIPLKPIDADHRPVTVFVFNTEQKVLATEDSFITHFVQVLKAMSTVNDKNTGKPIFNHNLHSESVYSILNYQFLNGTGTKFDPYHSDLITSLTLPGASSALAIETYPTFTHEYIEQYLDELNNKIAPFNTVITSLVKDRAYLSSNGISTCGSPMERKCLVGGKQWNSSACGGNGEAAADGCSLTPIVYNPFMNNSYSIFTTFIAIMITIVVTTFVY